MEDLTGSIDAPHIATAGCDLNQKAADLDEFVFAVVKPEDFIRGVDAPDFIRMTIVLVAYSDSDLRKDTRYLNELLFVVVEPVNVGCVESPDLVKL